MRHIAWLASGTAILLAIPLAGEAHAGRDAAIGLVSLEHLEVPAPRGGTTAFGTGAGLSLLYIELGENMPGGFEASTLFLGGPNGERLFDLGLSLIASAKLDEKKLITPYVKFGLDLASATIPPHVAGDAGGKDKDDSWVSLGVHGAVGVQGFVSDGVYWRVEGGWLGAGVGGLSGIVSFGWTFGKGL